MTELREDVVRLLCGIRSLATSLAQAHGDGADVIELVLVLSASELSLIPFEIAFHPGGPTRALAHSEVIVTRRSRRVPRGQLKWRQRPRVLMITANPDGVAAPPVEEHVEALKDALAARLAHLEGHHDKKCVLKELKKYLVLLPNATERSIQRTVAEAHAAGQDFSHVHVLAHGGELFSLEEADARDPLRPLRFGVVLHDSDHPRQADVLSGARLFSALAGTDSDCYRRLPQVVTFAMCNGATIGDVMVPGASIAHDIHDGGVPVVVASQFPLTFAGSVVLVRKEYEALLGGDDPRCALREARRSLHAAATLDLGPTDWGAIIQYGALPDDLEQRVREARIRALRQMIDAATASFDARSLPGGKGGPGTAWKLVQARARILAAHKDVEVDTYLARVSLRWAFLLWETWVSPVDPLAEAEAIELTPEVRAELIELMKPPGAEALPPPVIWPPPAFVRERLRLHRDGLRRTYQRTGDPVALAEALLGNFFTGTEVSRVQAVAAASECLDRMQGNSDKRAVRRFEVAIMFLWILDPLCNAFEMMKRTRELEHLMERDIDEATGTKWLEKRFDRQFVDAPPEFFEHFSTLRNVRRIGRVAERMNKAPQRTGEGYQPRVRVAERARAVAEFLESRGVPLSFSAVVDWVEDADGTTRTMPT